MQSGQTQSSVTHCSTWYSLETRTSVFVKELVLIAIKWGRSYWAIFCALCVRNLAIFLPRNADWYRQSPQSGHGQASGFSPTLCVSYKAAMSCLTGTGECSTTFTVFLRLLSCVSAEMHRSGNHDHAVSLL